MEVEMPLNKLTALCAKSGEYGGYERTSYPNDLIFCCCWDVVAENEGILFLMIIFK